MKWFGIRKASIPEDERDLFERLGASVVGAVLAGGFAPASKALQPMYGNHEMQDRAALWLTEQYDRTERRETWLITMEMAITLFVAFELVISFLTFIGVRGHR